MFFFPLFTFLQADQQTLSQISAMPVTETRSEK